MQMTKHLRYGADYGANDKALNKQLVWEEDFILEAEKCHGCSKCTTVTTATRMCPVYKVLKDEAAAPKAKANILRGLLSNVIDSEAMFQEGFQHVINHCINCGSCSIECPSKVNIPKLALEAKSRYAEKFGVSIDAKLATNFETAGRLTHKLSPLVSSVMAPKLMRKILKFTTGLTSERKFVRFATKSLNERNANALVENLVEEFEKNNIDYKHIEGRESSKWIVIDCYDYIIHIFNDDSRNYYNIDEILE